MRTSDCRLPHASVLWRHAADTEITLSWINILPAAILATRLCSRSFSVASPSLLLKIPQGTQKNYFAIKCLEVGYTRRENFVSPDIGRKSLKTMDLKRGPNYLASQGRPHVSCRPCCLTCNRKA
jgi:hypothetical protein